MRPSSEWVNGPPRLVQAGVRSRSPWILPARRRDRPNLRDAVGRLARIVLLASLTMLLSSCGLFVKILGGSTDCEQYAEAIDFETSDRIVRGTWVGTVQDYPTEGSGSELTIDLAASYLDRQAYEVSGTFVLEGEPPATIEGTVRGGCAERYESSGTSAQSVIGTSDLSPQSLPPGIFLDAEVRGSGGALLWNAGYSQPAAFESRGDTLRLSLVSAEANPHHSIRRDVDVVRTSP